MPAGIFETWHNGLQTRVAGQQRLADRHSAAVTFRAGCVRAELDDRPRPATSLDHNDRPLVLGFSDLVEYSLSLETSTPMEPVPRCKRAAQNTCRPLACVYRSPSDENRGRLRCLNLLPNDSRGWKRVLSEARRNTRFIDMNSFMSPLDSIEPEITSQVNCGTLVATLEMLE